VFRIGDISLPAETPLMDGDPLTIFGKNFDLLGEDMHDNGLVVITIRDGIVKAAILKMIVIRHPVYKLCDKRFKRLSWKRPETGFIKSKKYALPTAFPMLEVPFRKLQHTLSYSMI